MSARRGPAPIGDLLPGFKRQVVTCKKCRRHYYHDYQPYSLSNAVFTLPCGHGAGQRWTDAVRFVAEVKP